jgi:hypothetical protein
VVGSGGSLTVTPQSGSPFSASLEPFAGSPWNGPGKIVSPMHGLFYFLNAHDGDAPVFVTFFDGAMAFAEFVPQAMGDFTADPQVPAEYAYSYGVAVKVE